MFNLTFEQSLAGFCVALWTCIIIGMAIHAAVSPNEVVHKPRP